MYCPFLSCTVRSSSHNYTSQLATSEPALDRLVDAAADNLAPGFGGPLLPDIAVDALSFAAQT